MTTWATVLLAIQIPVYINHNVFLTVPLIQHAQIRELSQDVTQWNHTALSVKLTVIAHSQAFQPALTESVKNAITTLIAALILSKLDATQKNSHVDSACLIETVKLWILISSATWETGRVRSIAQWIMRMWSVRMRLKGVSAGSDIHAKIIYADPLGYSAFIIQR